MKVLLQIYDAYRVHNENDRISLLGFDKLRSLISDDFSAEFTGSKPEYVSANLYDWN